MGDDEQNGNLRRSLIGISLTSEAHARNPKQDCHLGFVTWSEACDTAASLRNLVCAQLPTLPTSFIFLTKEGWPVSRCQEKEVKVTHILSSAGIVRIQKSFEKPRIGIQAGDGTKLGFVFAELCCSTKILREIVSQQLGHLGCEDSPYQFIDRNGWPVAPQQENALAVMDIMVDSCVTIIPSVSFTKMLVSSEPESPEVISASYPYRSRPIRQLTFQTSKDLERTISSEHDPAEDKQILISYVRAESAEHAVCLKQELTSLGLSVFLDVDEIKTGEDWQDALNHAVSTCEVFVPLVTSRYGETQWTNREVKLADILEKFILPVSFLDHWPPRALAIQFATTQYIPWKTPQLVQEVMDDVDYFEDVDISAYSRWEPHCVRQVADEIRERIINHLETQKHLESLGLTKIDKQSGLKSCPAVLPGNNEYTSISHVSQDRKGRPLVVICVHPKQKILAEEIKSILVEENYEVWTTLELDSTGSDDEKSSQATDDGLMLSQYSLISHHSNISDSSCTEQRIQFQSKADEAGVVIFILSKIFALSRTSRQQVFYCEQRKKVIPVLCEEFNIPFWMSMLIGSGTFEKVNSNNFKASLKARVKCNLEQKSNRSCTLTQEEEAFLTKTCKNIKKTLAGVKTVYIAGSTKFYGKNTLQICQSIGQHLASLPDIHVVTGGFRGVQEVVANVFKENCTKNGRPCNLWQVMKEKNQQPAIPGAKPLTVPDLRCSWSRMVARVFDVCILLEGGPGAAREAECFVWNDTVVVPVRSTGGAAAGKFNVPEEMFKNPVGIAAEDWLILSNEKASPEEIGKSVTRIISCLSSGKRTLPENECNLASSHPSLNTARSVWHPLETGNTPKSPRRRRNPQRADTFVYNKKHRKEFL